jgi:uncharacterized protein YdhG (YjbR/CyaY superfamily)
MDTPRAVPANARETLMADEFATVDDYINSFPDDVQQILNELRRAIHEAVLGAGETISYKIPTITLDGRYLVYFAGSKHHVSVYPIPAIDESLEAQIAPYKASKGTLKFPLGKPIPYPLIQRLVKLLVDQRR